MKQIRYFSFFIFIAVILFGCNDSKYSMPNISSTNSGQTTSIVNIDIRTDIQGSVRAFGVNGSYPDNLNKSKKSVDIDWENDTWDDSANKPKLIICVYDRNNLSNHIVQEIDDSGYQYYKGSNGVAPKLHILTDISYLSSVDKGSQDLRVYLFDKKHNYTANSTNLTIDPMETLMPLNKDGSVASYDFVYSFSLKLSDIISSPNHSMVAKDGLKPVGSMLLFDMVNSSNQEVSYPSKISFHTNMFSKDFNINLTTGLSASNVDIDTDIVYNLDNGGDEKLENGERSYMYGIPVLLSETNTSVAGSLGISPLDATDRSSFGNKNISIPNFINSINGKMVSFSIDLNTYPQDKDYMITKWNKGDEAIGDAILMYILTNHGEEPIFEYRIEGSNEWHKLAYESRDYQNVNVPHNKQIRLSGLDNIHNIVEIRMIGVYGFSIDATYSHAKDRLLEVKQWGTTKFLTMYEMFSGCENMDVTATDVPDLSNCTNLYAMFDDCRIMKGNNSFSKWDTSNIKNMDHMFSSAYSFNQDISGWNTSGVTNMRSMFAAAKNFNQPIGGWDVSKVTNMRNMFDGAISFNQPIGGWDVSSVTDMAYMFKGATSFDQPIGGWDVSSVTDMAYMFKGATSFDQPIGEWNVGKVGYMYNMFDGAKNFNQPIGGWDVSSVTDMTSMFDGDTSFNQPIGDWNVSRVSDMTSMFKGATSFNQPIGKWNVEGALLMKAMFAGASSFNQDISDWKVGNVYQMDSIFTGAKSFNQPIGKWNVSEVESMAHMFAGAISFNQDISSWNTSKVTDMSYMFWQAESFNKPIGSWNVEKVTNMNSMFGSTSEFNQDISSWNTSSVTNMDYMFFNALEFNQDISGWNVSNVTESKDLFLGCPIEEGYKPAKFR